MWYSHRIISGISYSQNMVVCCFAAVLQSYSVKPYRLTYSEHLTILDFDLGFDSADSAEWYIEKCVGWERESKRRVFKVIWQWYIPDVPASQSNSKYSWLSKQKILKQKYSLHLNVCLVKCCDSIQFCMELHSVLYSHMSFSMWLSCSWLQ